jgi:hypothetical protein
MDDDRPPAEDIVTRRPGAPLVIAVLSMVAAVLAASRLSDHVRWVDMVALFGTGFGTGAGLVSGLMRLRQGSRPTE